METIYQYYKSTQTRSQQASLSLKKTTYWLENLRLFVVIGMIITLWLFWEQGWIVLSLVFVAWLLFFVLLIIRYNCLCRKMTYAKKLTVLCTNELKALNYDFSAFDGALDKANPTHPYSFDLDLFGKCSLFQSVNRTVTKEGQEKLTEWFLNPLTTRHDIVRRQQAIQELSSCVSMRQHFYVTGTINKHQKADIEAISGLKKASIYFSKYNIWKFLFWFTPIIWVGIFITFFSGQLTIIMLLLFLTLGGLLANCKFKSINRLQRLMCHADKVFACYADLFEIIEKEQFVSDELLNVKARLLSDKISASKAVKQLSHILNALEQRGNMFIAFVGIFTLRDIKFAQKMLLWKETYQNSIDIWFGGLAEFDALLSLAGFAYNHPDYIFPTISEKYCTISGKGLGHPLLHRNIVVKNDICIKDSPNLLIVTGANMAGKSTYLRTIGINFLLSCIGAPVCAEKLTVYPATLITSLRTSDSLIHNESYFFAELKRLKMIVDKLRDGAKLFIILDEILKGTNSVDKQKGSLALIEQFISYRTCGIIATHDLILGTMQAKFPLYVHNWCFEANIVDNQLNFSYRMHSGIAQNMNACFLMNKMGIINSNHEITNLGSVN